MTPSTFDFDDVVVVPTVSLNPKKAKKKMKKAIRKEEEMAAQLPGALACSMFHLCTVSTAGVKFCMQNIAFQLLKHYFGPLKRYSCGEADSPGIA